MSSPLLREAVMRALLPIIPLLAACNVRPGEATGRPPGCHRGVHALFVARRRGRLGGGNIQDWG